MKKFKFLASAIALSLVSLTLFSCMDGDDEYKWDYYPNALVTVKPNLDNSSFYMQLDDSTTLLPANMKTSPFGTKEVRALASFSSSDIDPNPYSMAVNINWLDSIRTKDMVMTIANDGDNIYGNDPVEILDDWVTIAEDGYLTLRFQSNTYYDAKPIVNLIGSADPTDPYKVVFSCEAKGEQNAGLADGIVAFRLKYLPDTQGKTVDLTLEWNSFSGKKTTKFKYCTRKSTNPGALKGITNLRDFMKVQ